MDTIIHPTTIEESQCGAIQTLFVPTIQTITGGIGLEPDHRSLCHGENSLLRSITSIMCNTGQLYQADTSFDVFVEVLTFLKQHQQQLQQQNEDILSHQHLSLLQEEIISNISELLTPTNACKCLQTAKKLQLTLLEQHCRNYITTNPHSVTHSDTFTTLDEDLVVEILESNPDMHIQVDEMFILEAIVKWGEATLRREGRSLSNDTLAEQIKNVIKAAPLPQIKSQVLCKKQRASAPTASPSIQCHKKPRKFISFLVQSYDLTYAVKDGELIPVVNSE